MQQSWVSQQCLRVRGYQVSWLAVTGYEPEARQPCEPFRWHHSWSWPPGRGQWMMHHQQQQPQHWHQGAVILKGCLFVIVVWEWAPARQRGGKNQEDLIQRMSDFFWNVQAEKQHFLTGDADVILSCFFLSSICFVAASIICFICEIRIAEKLSIQNMYCKNNFR